MATKTVVCPECGAAAAPGRYACADCGALLAAVSVQPRTWAPEDVLDGPAEAPARDASGADEGSQDSAPAAVGVAVAIAEPPAPPMAEPAPPDGEAVAEPSWPDQPWDPIQAQSSVLVQAHATLEDDSDADEGADEPARPAWSAASARADGAGILDAPIRTPAGSYLPPTAVLASLDETAAAAAPSAAPRSAGRSAALLESIQLTNDAPGRVIAAGAALATVGFVLPWVGSLSSAASLTGYFTLWGLAGPGHWLVAAAVLALGALAAAPGRLAGRSFRLPSVGIGALLFGLVWPYAFGGGPSLGALAALVGAGLLVAGGLLDRRSTSRPAAPAG
jgi:hypothetical protein